MRFSSTSVVGLPSADALLEAVCSLTPHTLADLRRQFSAMGFADSEDDSGATGIPGVP